MRKVIFAALAALFVYTAPGANPTQADSARFYEVTGVEDDDMLKLRSGPGTDFRVIVGLPNGTIVRLYDCEQIGPNEWCKVSLKETRALKGYVSWHYLQAQ